MMWIPQVVLLLVGCSITDAVLQMSSTCDSYKYGGNCTVRCTNFKGQDHEMYYNNKKVVNGDTYDVSVQFNIQIVVKMKLTMDTAGEYSCKAPGMTTAKAVVRMDVEAKAPKAMYYLLIGSKATVNTTVYGYPRPATYTYKKKYGNVTYQTVAQYNTRTNLMDVGIGKYEINGQNAHLTITKVVLSDGGEYMVSDGGTSSASFKIEAGSPPKIKTKPAPSYDVVSGVAATFKCEFESLDKLTVVTWIHTSKGGTPKTITNTSTGAVTLDGTNLKITPVVANKGDSFKCVGSSVFGKDEASTVIGNVYIKPAIKAMTNLQVYVGSKKDISCEATGGPNLAISWMKKGKDGKFTELPGQVKRAGKSAYSITSVAASDAGDYKCIAVITAKPELKDEAMLSVEVISSTVISTSSSSTVKYLIGKATEKVLTCIASGIPSPTIKFIKGKVELRRTVMKREGHIVTGTAHYVANVTADAGIITCVAENKINKATHNITIAFIYKPSAVLLKPEGLPVSFFYNEVEFAWVKPASDGGSTSLKYEVKYCPQSNGAYPSSLCKAVTTRITTVTLKGLKEHTMYSFTISAKNVRGYGPPLTFQALTGSEIGPSFGAVAGIVIADILIMFLVIDSYCCHFIDRGFLYYIYQRYYNGKGKQTNCKFYQ